MSKIVVTAGGYADIDVFACAVAYAELLTLEGKQATTVIPKILTASITPTVLSWGAIYETDYTPTGDETFVLVDISDPDAFAPYVVHERIAEVYDHRYGHEEYWKEKLDKDAHIEMVGACATLIFEEFEERGKFPVMSTLSAKLLLAAIVSNTLNFNATLTTGRDRSAYEKLKVGSVLAEEWVAEYFKEQEELIFSDFERWLLADTKQFTIQGKPFIIGQIELWNARPVIAERLSHIDTAYREYGDIPWVVNIVSISEGKSYLYARHPVAQVALVQALGVLFEKNIAITKELFMRKQIFKALLESRK